MPKKRFADEQIGFCAAAGFGRASHRYTSRRDSQVALRMRLKELAGARVRHALPDRRLQANAERGYRRLHLLLRREGWRANHKKIDRLYSEEGLSIADARARIEDWRTDHTET